MDPYLEDPGLWPDVHHELISVSRELLGIALRPRYHVRVEERVYISDEIEQVKSVIAPDLHLTERKPGSWDRAQFMATDSAEPLVVTSVIFEDNHEARLEIIDRSSREVVTVIEIISLTNKSGARGQASYEQKRQEVLNSTSHLVEIDLLRSGERMPIVEEYPDCEYVVHVSRAPLRPKGGLWPIRLPEPLPIIKVPLKPADPDASLDLQLVLQMAYDRAAFDVEIEYQREPAIPLAPAMAAWADSLLRDCGLRS
jgi:hypothetical protein